MKKMICYALCALLYAETATPLAPQNFRMPTEQEQAQEKKVEDLKTNAFLLNSDPKDVAPVIEQEQKMRDAFDQFSEKEINYKPVIRPIASMDTIALHPYFTFSLLLPQGAMISHVDSSSEMAMLEYRANTLIMRPKSDFRIANFTILYQYKERNHILTIVANRYKKEPTRDKLNLVYSYRDIVKRDKMEVMAAFILENGGYPTDKYSYIYIDNIVYRIVEDELYGEIGVGEKRYRIDNNVIYK